MHSLYVPPAQIEEKLAFIRGEERHHIDVLRLRVGDRIRLLDGLGTVYDGVISHISRHEAIVKLSGRRRRHPMKRVDLYQGLPKGEKFELIIQKATELGVSSITPVICRRSIPRIEGRKLPDRLRRWNRIAIEACKQSGRALFPKLNPPRSLDEVLRIAEADLKLMLWEGERDRKLRHVLKGIAPESVALLIGPEGGFDEVEVQSALDARFYTVTLGELILRTETAAIAALSLLQYELGQLG
jgi:16S rRNA (uracil1498-N3)-methyltransferase